MALLRKVELLPAGARTVTGNGNEFDFSPDAGFAEFQLDVTAAATEAGDTLDVFVQTSVDGVNWIDIVHFTQVLGNGGAKRHVAKILRDVAEAMFEAGTALAAGAVRNIFGTKFRVRWTIADVATLGNQSFNFSVNANAGLYG